MNTDRSKPKAPAHLRAPTRRWFDSVVSDYTLDLHHVKLLTLACEALDRSEECREAIKTEGMTIEGLHGRRAHPLLAIERDSRLTFARLLKALNLDEDDGNGATGRGRK